uniref:Uncharacterized protein n=1 Tax=Babesia bovis TaxID=5865 RepID=S6BGT2_BABBO|nr:hypothetical protein [Babesia bovis]
MSPTTQSENLENELSMRHINDTRANKSSCPWQRSVYSVSVIPSEPATLRMNSSLNSYGLISATLDNVHNSRGSFKAAGWWL